MEMDSTDGQTSPRSDGRHSRLGWLMSETDSEFPSDSEDGRIDNWEDQPIYPELNEHLEEYDELDRDSSSNATNGSIAESIAREEMDATYHAVALFLESNSTVFNIAECKFKQGRNFELRNKVPLSTLVREERDGQVDNFPVPRSHDFTIQAVSGLGDYESYVEEFGTPESPAQFLARLQPPPYEGSLPRFVQYEAYLRELICLRGRLDEVIQRVISSLDEEDWRIVFHDSIELFVEDGEGFLRYKFKKTDYFRETSSTSNALLSEEENYFLRSSASRFRLHGRQDLHDALLDVLRVQICGSKTVQQLLTAGYLQSTATRQAAFHMLWVLERVGFETLVEATERA
jgi:hypothetical protein